MTQRWRLPQLLVKWMPQRLSRLPTRRMGQVGMFDQQRGPLLGNVAEKDFLPTRCQDVWT